MNCIRIVCLVSASSSSGLSSYSPSDTHSFPSNASSEYSSTPFTLFLPLSLFEILPQIILKEHYACPYIGIRRSMMIGMRVVGETGEGTSSLGRDAGERRGRR
jgi:hypothetical protein